MPQALRVCFLALYAVGPVVAVLALWRRGLRGSRVEDRVKGWRWHVPTVLLPIEWLLPPVLILLGVGELQVEWLPLRFFGLAVGVGGAVLLTWAAVVLGRFLVHEAAVLEHHVLVTSGPYRFVRHPVYTGYLALLLGSGLGTLNIYLLLLWPVSLCGILVQAGSEERLLASKFGQAYQSYADQTGQLLPHFRRRDGG